VVLRLNSSSFPRYIAALDVSPRPPLASLLFSLRWCWERWPLFLLRHCMVHYLFLMCCCIFSYTSSFFRSDKHCLEYLSSTLSVLERLIFVSHSEVEREVILFFLLFFIATKFVLDSFLHYLVDPLFHRLFPSLIARRCLGKAYNH